MAQAATSATAPIHANSIPNPHHRKIELQSHADLIYLQQNLTKAAKARLDVHFPPQVNWNEKGGIKNAAPAEVITLGGGSQPILPESQEEQNGEIQEEDVMKQKIRLLLDSFLQQTYTSAAHSLSINGIDATNLTSSQFLNCSEPTVLLNPESDNTSDPSHEIEGIHYTYAPYDTRLKQRIQNLYRETEELRTQVSKLRKEVPKSSAEQYKAQLAAALAKDEEDWENEQTKLKAHIHEGLHLDAMRDGWNEDVRDVYARGVDGLAILSGVKQKTNERTSNMASLMGTAGKAERARVVLAELE